MSKQRKSEQMAAQTRKPERANETAARGSGSDGPGDRGSPRYRFAAPVRVSREDIAERIAEHVARCSTKPNYPFRDRRQYDNTRAYLRDLASYRATETFDPGYFEPFTVTLGAPDV